jgi:cytochrome c-type biogenesis protein CcmH/NrfF
MRLVVAVLASLVLGAPAFASESHPTRAELEAELVCPTCQGPLDQSDAPIARRMKEFIAARIAAGDTKSEIKAALVAQFGEQVLAAPPRKGFNLLAWLLPLVGVGGGAVVLGVLAWRWSRKSARTEPVTAAASRNGQRALEPELERRVDEALARFE